ncbi:Per1-like protein [Lentinula aff. detonsa]|uniref:Post-GPI attachment to proteins factor 3 n=1 Tax=Lentinula aff. detonsa TaxID=2804958 RepID=A0AA38NNG1_9AGAR|nr:Per1-like protein [Lentinula aff. detonsa]
MRAIFALPILAILSSVYASAGDRAHDFQRCTFMCDNRECKNHSPTPLPLALRITKWTCLDNCKYNCMHEITINLTAAGKRPLQYYGKWPFIRVAGMQEPCSVLFSLFNLWVHFQGYSRIQKMIPRIHPLKTYYLVWSVASMNTWIWSAVFHTRDTPLTEKFDYFSAAFTILTALYFTAIRFFHLYTPSARALPAPVRIMAFRAWTTICVVTFIGHILYLSLPPRFDYRYNIIFNLVIGLSHNALWLLYSLPESMSLLTRFPNRLRTYCPRRLANKAAVLVTLTTAATAFELFDFPPWRKVIDAHALWHLVTAPIACAWYHFLILDASDPSWKEIR